MKKLIFVFLFTLFVELLAVPRFALMRGNQCRDCHYNPTGGLIRNKDGWTYGKNNLRLIKSSNTETISPYINENISIGFDFRYQFLYSQELNKSDFHKMAGGVYTNFDLSDEINFIASYDLYRGYFEGYGVLKFLPLDGYLKIGSFSPNFGIKIDDHTAYTKNGDFGFLSSGATQGLIFSPGYSQTGLELGIYPTDFLFITLSAGQDKIPFRTDPSYIGRIEFNPSLDNFNLLFGSSYGIFKEVVKKFNFFSLFGGFGYSNFSVLSEIALAKDYVNPDTTSFALMLETSYRIVRGLEFVTRYDQMLPNTKQKGIYSSHIIFGFDFYPYHFVEIKTQYRLNVEKPKVDKNNSVVVQFHFWY